MRNLFIIAASITGPALVVPGSTAAPIELSPGQQYQSAAAIPLYEKPFQQSSSWALMPNVVFRVLVTTRQFGEQWWKIETPGDPDLTTRSNWISDRDMPDVLPTNEAIVIGETSDPVASDMLVDLPIEWDLIDDIEHPLGVWRHAVIQLNQRLHLSQLPAIAEEVRIWSDANRTTISFVLPGMLPDAAAWGKVEFAGDVLQTSQVLGLSPTDARQLLGTASPAGEIVGQWFAEPQLNCLLTIVRNPGGRAGSYEYSLVHRYPTTYGDGDERIEDIELHERSGEMRYESVGAGKIALLGKADYLVLASDGRLELHGSGISQAMAHEPSPQVLSVAMSVPNCALPPPQIDSPFASLPLKPYESEPGPMFEVVQERVTDIPIKTQIEQHLVVTGPVSEAQLRTELTQRFGELKARTGFKYRDRAEMFFIYIYGTHEQAKSGQGLQGAWLICDRSGVPKISIDMEKLSDAPIQGLSNPEFSLEKRKLIFREMVLAEDRAVAEAERRVPNLQSLKDLERQAEISGQLTEKYHRDLCRKFGISEKQRRDVVVEGVMKGWPMP